MGQQHPQFLAAQRLYMDRSVKPHPHHLRNAAGIIAIGLVDLCLRAPGNLESLLGPRFRGHERISQPTNPDAGFTASLPGNTVCASALSSARRWSRRMPLSTARRSVVGLRSRS